VIEPGAWPTALEISFCLNYHCIQTGIQRTLQEGKVVEPFQNRIAVLDKMPEEQLPSVQGIQWVQF
jgi:hypothetical protein